MRWLVLLACSSVAAAEPVIDRGAYRIELGSQPRVVFENGDTINVALANNKIVGLEGVRADRHGLPPVDEPLAAAILLARDVATRINDKPQIRAIPLDTQPPLVLFSYGTQWYLQRIGLVRTSTPDPHVHRCLLAQRCELVIEGPDGTGVAKFEWGRLVKRPQVRTQPRRAWKELVPARIVRARAALIDAEHALDGDRDAARSHLVDALDAIDDIVVAMPMNAPRAIEYEILRDDTRATIGELDTLGSDAVIALRLALVRIQR